jgi:hypothetical protein
MSYTVSRVEIWKGEMDDRAGGLAAKLEAVSNAEINLEMVIARRQPDKPGKGVVFLGPLKGPKAEKAAAAAGLTKTSELTALRVEGTDKPGECHRMIRRLSDAGVNLRGVSAAVLGNKFVTCLAFDNDADATKAARLLQGEAKQK